MCDLLRLVDFLAGCCEILTLHLTLGVTSYNFLEGNAYQWAGSVQWGCSLGVGVLSLEVGPGLPGKLQHQRRGKADPGVG